MKNTITNTITALFLALTLSMSLQSCSTVDSKPVENLKTLNAELPLTVEEIDTVQNSADGITILKASTCSEIENREPVGESQTFSSDVGRIYLYTKVEMDAGSSSNIQHVWKREGKVISTVKLKVQGPTWRTRSYKTIHPNMSGNYSVDIQSEGGKLIQTVSFKVQ